MKKLIIYFREPFAPNTSIKQIAQLKKAFPNEYVYSILIYDDPKLNYSRIEHFIDGVLLDHLNEEVNLILVGNCLSGWWASEFAVKYGAIAILTDVCNHPELLLKKHKIPQEIIDQYYVKDFSEKNHYFAGFNHNFIEIINSSGK